MFISIVTTLIFTGYLSVYQNVHKNDNLREPLSTIVFSLLLFVGIMLTSVAWALLAKEIVLIGEMALDAKEEKDLYLVLMALAAQALWIMKSIVLFSLPKSALGIAKTLIRRLV